MTHDDRDPTLEALFAAAEQELAGPTFTERVMARTDRLRRRNLILKVGIYALAAALVIPLKDLALVVTRLLAVPLVVLEDLALAEILAPINNLGSLLSLVLVGLRLGYKRLLG